MADCPYRYQGQYEDVETGLYYNRFRYYAPDQGIYISQDPIGLAGEMPNMYSNVHNSNGWIDPFGLAEHITFPNESLHPKAQGTFTVKATGYHHADKVALYKSAGLKESFDSSKWISHHVSYNPDTGDMRMQLVSLEAHKKSHIGGVNDFENHPKVKYNTDDASKIAKACK
ncbi:RHS repeat-associated core domain-containing protein [Cellulophaga sp. L1A9]|uniref:RHS repeat-associated core domain-containing protein n=1 Tax=Cellulophaga sp. L1A9 TaxID=2686362 RepID=UPI001E353E69|nr:RHS repeat-associated core domain-containing protein [Cellulophaga sp. L1A9]